MPSEVRLSDGAVLWTDSSWLSGAPGAVFLHGGPGMWDYLEPLATPLADLVSTHRYDQRGCGRSSASTDYRMSRFVADLDELRAHLGHERWVVVGHSFGAALGLAYANEHPDRVLGLVYLNGLGLDWTVHKAAYRERVRQRLSTQQVARREELAARERTWDEEVEWRALCWAPDFVDPAMAAVDAGTELPLNRLCNAVMNEEDPPVRYEQVRAPVLLVHGAADPRPVDGVKALANAMPTAELVVLDGAAHQPWREQPEAVTALLREFVARVAR
ncbi:prolyl aminopeptidase [Kutzneria viridogrisea]|uniref:Proline iminopeptidase n=1 Tax=Kutzneria viridogrisea TaxID=47990 RepID=A0ABR6BE58_9PSEU|nr:proline iminopeptidase [Kutzneria viridogrisea]